MSIDIDIYSLIIILLGTLLVLVALIIFLLKFKRNRKSQESIPGVEEMAKTTFFWSDYHRGKIGKDD